tara:strand:+ start:128 stop:790 length:663 start_codon:yes stop_codon:yes gene_type:complete
MINLIFSYLSNLNLNILNSCSKFNIIDILFITTTLFSFGNLFPFNILLVFLITQAYNKDSSNIFKSFTEISFEYYTKITNKINKYKKKTDSNENTKKSMNNDINTKCNQKEHPKEDDNDFCNNKINSEYNQNEQDSNNIQKKVSEMSKDLCENDRDILNQFSLENSRPVLSDNNDDIKTEDNGIKEQYDFDSIREKIKNSFDNIRYSNDKNKDLDSSRIY